MLPKLARRAERVAAAAQPATGLTLSLCMIVRDEEEMLPRCLAAVRDAVDEIIVVDTGSTDRTIEIAESFGAKVIEREWTGSFADARNVSFDAATGDWVMCLDADEVLVADDAQRLREILGRTWREAFYLVETNFTGELGDGTAVTHNALRVFRNRPEYRFEGRIHEQIAHNLPSGQPERIEITDVRVEHYGYLGVVRDAKDKSRRNIELLERQRDEAGEDSGFLHFNLGSEYAALGENDDACASFETSWEIMRGRPDLAAYGYIPALVARLVRARRLTGKLQESVDLADEGLRLLPGFTDLVYEQAQAAAEAGRQDARDRAVRAVPRDGRRAEQVLGDRRPRQLPRPRRAGHAAPRGGRRRGRRGLLGPLPLRSPAVHRRRRPVRGRDARVRRRRPRRCSPTSRTASRS